MPDTDVGVPPCHAPVKVKRLTWVLLKVVWACLAGWKLATATRRLSGGGLWRSVLQVNGHLGMQP